MIKHKSLKVSLYDEYKLNSIKSSNLVVSPSYYLSI